MIAPVDINGPIRASGVYRLAMEQYHGQTAADAPSLSASDAVILTRQTPAHLRTAWAKDAERARKRDLGACIHALVLEPFQAAAQIEIIDAEDYRKKEAKEAADLAFAAGKTPILAPDYETAKRVADRVLNHKAAARYLDGIAEPSFYAKDDALGIYSKARPDIITPKLDVADLKTVGSCDIEFIKRRVYDGGWFQQCPFHCHTIERVTGEPIRDFVWICVEQEEPHAIRVLPAHEAAIIHGARLNDKAARVFAACCKSDYWPAYSDEREEPVGLPDYAYFKLEAGVAVEQDRDLRAVEIAAEMEFAASPFS